MRSLKTLLVFAVAIVGTFGMAGVVAGQALEDISAYAPPGPPPDFNVPMWDGPDVVLYDNGPMVTHPGGGAGGADASALQGALGNTIYGFGHAISSGFRVADDFTVPAGGWLINQVTFFAYQTGSATTSTINNVNLRIWNGPPNAGGSVIWGDTTTNVLATTQWSNIYRVLDTDLLTTNRPIMADTVTVGTVLAAGTYWLDWQTGGTLASGPWAPPVTILGQTGKPGANALQFNPTTATWGPALDTTFPQDLPFIIEGTVVGGQNPAIELNKTVGVVPGVCATTDSITVSTGTPVYYCYQVENTGDVTFNFHDLVDDQLGTILNDLPYVLAPGAFSPEVIVPDVVSGPVVNTGTWTAATAVGGYAVDDTIPYNWEDISTSGTQIALGDDQMSDAIPLGFTFDYYGTGYSDIYVSSNGFLTVLPGQYNGCCSGQPMPTPGDPDGVIAGWWNDLYPPGGGPVTYQTLGSAPNRYLIVQFTNVPHCCSAGYAPVTMQFKLYETTGVIEVHYQGAESNLGTHSAGLENQDGTVGVQYYYGTSALTTPEAVRYTPAPSQEASDTDTASVQISDPDITVNPATLVSTQVPDQVITQPLDIGNVGTADLVWDLEEAPPIEIPASNGIFPRGKVGPSYGPAPAERMATAPPGVPNTSLLRQVGTWAFSTEIATSTHIYFDSDTPGTFVNLGPASEWIWAGDFVGSDLTKTYAILMNSNNLVTIDAVSGAQTVVGTLAAPPVNAIYTGMTYDPSTGNVYATACDIISSWLYTVNVATATVSLVGTISNSPCSIAIAATDAGALYTYDIVNDSLLMVDKASAAGTIIGSIGFDANFGQGMDWDSASSTMYMAAVNGGTGQAEFRAVDLTTGNTTLLGALGPAGSQLGYLAFQSGGPCSAPADIPWLSVNPISGTVPPAGVANLGVTFDSTGLAIGLYEGVLCVRSNDPDEPLVEVPVTLDVVIPVELQSISVE